MGSDSHNTWTSFGGSVPGHWMFESVGNLIKESGGVSVGVMYPGPNTSNGVPLIRVADIADGRVQGLPAYRVSEEKDEEHRRTRLIGDELLLTLVGNPGECLAVTQSMIGWNVARAIAVMRLKRPSLRGWLRLAISSGPAQKFLSSRFNTTVQKTLNLKDIRELILPIPPECEQRAIAHILGSLDDKIELNRQMNETLESMAQALFKSWFVDFDPVIDNAIAAGNPIPAPLQARAAARKKLAGSRKPLPQNIQKQFPDRFVPSDKMDWVPSGWETNRLGDYVTVRRGGSPRPIHDFLSVEGLPWVKISDATASPSRFLMKTKEFIKPSGLNKTVLLKSGELILSNSATPGMPMFLELEACIHDGWLYFPAKKHFSDLYLYQRFPANHEIAVFAGF